MYNGTGHTSAPVHVTLRICSHDDCGKFRRTLQINQINIFRECTVAERSNLEPSRVKQFVRKLFWFNLN